MDIPAAAPAQSGNQSDSDLLQQPSTPLTWITFGGAAHESSAGFIQSIQRLAFQQNRTRDDRWITEYAATCFDGEALFWYLELEEEIQESWKRLRLALARRFPSVPGPTETSTISNSLSSAPASAFGGISISNAAGKRGRIQVVGPLASTLGYLAFHMTSGISITTSEDKAVIVTRPDPASLEPRPSKPYHIQMMGLSGPSAAFPFLGLALLKDPSEGCAIPERVDVRRESRSSYTNVPLPSPACKAKEIQGSIHPSSLRPKLATWILSNCGRSPASLALLRKSATQASNTRATAAIWKYGSETDDLYLSWLMDDEKECELAVYVHSQTNANLHVHRPNDVKEEEAGRWLDEVRVQFVFKEIP